MSFSALLFALLVGCSSSTTAEPPGTQGAPRAEGRDERPSPPPLELHDSRCTSDSDCTPAPACCPAPCTSDVVNRVSGARLAAEVARTCTPELRAQCVSAGTCPTHAYLCVRGECALVYEDSPDYRER